MTIRGLPFTAPGILGLMACAECGTVSPGICPECGSAEKVKTVTRRVMRRQPARHANGLWRWHHGDKPYEYISWAHGDMPKQTLGRSAPHRPGDIVYAKEALAAMPHYVGEDYVEGDGYMPPPELITAKYLASQTPVSYAEGAKQGWCGKAMWQWKHPYLSSRFMPRWAARIWREVVEVRAQWLQDISEEDAIAEGIRTYWERCCDADQWPDGWREAGEDPRGVFRLLWDSLHAKRHGGAFVWKENPMVFAYTLKVSSRKGAEGAKEKR